MAVARMKRALIIGYETDARQLTRSLQRGGVIHVESTELVEGDGPPERREELEAEENEFSDKLDDARFVLDLLARHRTPPKRPFASFISEKFHIDVREFETISRHVNFDHLLSVCREVESGLAELDRQVAPLLRRQLALEPWTWLDVPLSELRGTQHTSMIGFRGDEDTIAGLAALYDTEGVVADVMTHEESALVVAYGADANAARRIAGEAELTEDELPEGSDTPVAELEGVQAERAVLEEQRRELERRLEALAHLYRDVFALVRDLENAVERVRARSSFGSTQRAVFIEGWVREDRERELTVALAPYEAVDYCLTDPLPDEVPPVELANPRWLQPFELLTRLYGMPDYGELDPTPWLALPFALFFGICMGDAGYGLLLMLGGWLALKYLDIDENPKKFMRLLIYGGAFSILFGALTGSYFAIPVESLPPFMRGIVLFDPLTEATVFFIVSIALGVIHVSLGVLLEAYDEFRNGRVFEAIGTQGSTLLVFLCGVVAFACWMATVIAGGLPEPVAVLYSVSLKGLVLGAAGLVLLTGGFFRPLKEAYQAKPGARVWIDRIVGSVLALVALTWVLGAMVGVGLVSGRALLAMAVVALVVSRAGRRMVGGGLLGFYELYGMFGFVGDVLSYARLMAIGLSSLLIGMTVNQLAGLILGGLPEWSGGEAGQMIGFALLFALVAVAGLLVLVFGHVFNVAINLLGSFVHPMRLQYVEFFSKFYDGRGKPFEPLAYTTGVLVLDESET